MYIKPQLSKTEFRLAFILLRHQQHQHQHQHQLLLLLLLLLSLTDCKAMWLSTVASVSPSTDSSLQLPMYSSVTVYTCFCISLYRF